MSSAFNLICMKMNTIFKAHLGCFPLKKRHCDCFHHCLAVLLSNGETALCINAFCFVSRHLGGSWATLSGSALTKETGVSATAAEGFGGRCSGRSSGLALGCWAAGCSMLSGCQLLHPTHSERGGFNLASSGNIHLIPAGNLQKHGNSIIWS